MSGAVTAVGAGLASLGGAVGASATVAGGLGVIGTGASLISGAVGAVGAIESGNAQKASANYNTQVAAENAQVQTNNANMASAEGSQNVANQQQKTRAEVGSIKAAQAANNIDVGTGSAVDVRSSATELGELSAINIRANAARTAYGYQTAAASDTAQSNLDKAQGQYAQTAGDIGAGTTLLGTAGSAALKYSQFLTAASPLTSADDAFLASARQSASSNNY